MHKLLDSAGGAAVTAGETSQIIRVGPTGYFQVAIVGDMAGGTLTLQQRLEAGGTWYTFTYDGVAQTWTNTVLSSATATDRKTYIVGECDLRFNLATAGTPTIYVGGTYVTPVDPLRP
jgi:hypothetical protein